MNAIFAYNANSSGFLRLVDNYDYGKDGILDSFFESAVYKKTKFYRSPLDSCVYDAEAKKVSAEATGLFASAGVQSETARASVVVYHGVSGGWVADLTITSLTSGKVLQSTVGMTIPMMQVDPFAA